MIFTECIKCNSPFQYEYEAGDKPCGKNVFAEVICPNCKEVNYVERVSVGGRTVSKEYIEKNCKPMKTIH